MPQADSQQAAEIASRLEADMFHRLSLELGTSASNEIVPDVELQSCDGGTCGVDKHGQVDAPVGRYLQQLRLNA